jgi:hypothetical protein
VAHGRGCGVGPVAGPLAAKGEITACGRLGSAIQPYHSQYVYDGDRSAAPTAWQEAVAHAEILMVEARTDHDVARQLLVWLTAGSASLAQFEQQRAYLFGAGIPAAFLPGPASLGRDDLV